MPGTDLALLIGVNRPIPWKEVSVLRTRPLLAIAGLILLSSPAGAVPVSSNLFTIEVVGEGTAVLDGDDIGCVAGSKAGTFDCAGSNVDMVGGAITLDNWNMSLDTDPVIQNIIAVSNNTLVTQTYVLSVLLPVVPVLPSSVIGGSVQGGITSDASAGTLSSNGVTGNAIYTALIDGVSVGTLLPDPSSISSGAFLSTNFLEPPNTLSFGNPIPSAPGPAALASIGINLEFTLTPGDSASFTSIFVVEAVPEPGTAILMGVGLATLGYRSRRQRLG